jgi:beta-glucosidase
MTYCRSTLLVGLSLGFAFSLARGQASHDAPSNAQLSNPEIERKVDALLKQMTLDEKIGQLVQYSATEAHPEKPAGDSTAALNVNPPGPGGIDSYALAQKGELGSMLNTVGQSLTNHFQHAAVDNTRLHIPLLFGADVIHGFRTIFPVPLATASSWNPALVTELAHGRH